METTRLREQSDLQFFDPLAEIRLLESGHAGAHERVRDEINTFAAETLEAPLTTPFYYEFDNYTFITVDGSELSTLLTNGLEAAWGLSQENQLYMFEYERSVIDAGRHTRMVDLMDKEVGSGFYIISAFPEEMAHKYGPKVLEEIGYQPDRQLAFARFYEKTAENELKETCVSLDGSNLEVFKELLKQNGHDVSSIKTSLDLLSFEIHSDNMQGEQKRFVSQFDALKNRDDPMRRKYSQGRELKDGEERIDAWNFVIHNQDVIDLHVDLLDDIAKVRTGKEQSTLLSKVLSEMSLAKSNAGYEMFPPKIRNILLEAAEYPEILHSNQDAKLVRNAIAYMTFATLRSRFNTAKEQNGLELVIGRKNSGLLREMFSATDTALQNLEKIVGCGGVIDLLESGSAQDVMQAAMNGEVYSFNKIDHCVSCDPQAQKPPVPCGPCNMCWRCDIQSARMTLKAA